MVDWQKLALILALVFPVGCAVGAAGAGEGVDIVGPGDVTSTQDETDAPNDAAVVAADALDTLDLDPDSGAPVAPAEAFGALEIAWCDGYAIRYCAATVSCDCGAAPGFPAGAACEASFVAQCRTLLAPYRSAVLSGQAVVDPDGIAPCLDRIEVLANQCGTLPSDSFFVDCPILVPPGELQPLPDELEACAEGGRCAVGLRCDTAGICRTPGGIGAHCDGPTECAPGLRCPDGTCAPLDTTQSGQACAPNASCGLLVCAASAHKTCIAIAPGDSCQSDEDCLAVEYCLNATCSPLPVASAPCGNGAACAEGLGCDAGGLCATLPESGSACALGVMGPLLCAPGTTCIDGLCGGIPGLDQPCAQGHPACAPGLGCAFEPSGSACRTPAPEGSPCQNDATCATGLYCEFTENACRPWVTHGGLCSAGNECGPDGACLPDATFTFRCAAIPDAGEACFLFDCGPGLACRSPHAEGACVRDFCTALKF